MLLCLLSFWPKTRNFCITSCSLILYTLQPCLESLILVRHLWFCLRTGLTSSVSRLLICNFLVALATSFFISCCLSAEFKLSSVDTENNERNTVRRFSSAVNSEFGNYDGVDRSLCSSSLSSSTWSTLLSVTPAGSTILLMQTFLTKEKTSSNSDFLNGRAEPESKQKV